MEFEMLNIDSDIVQSTDCGERKTDEEKKCLRMTKNDYMDISN